MSFERRILTLNEAQEITDFELKKASEDDFSNWTAPWRAESLNHYLPLGWSFGLWVQNQLQGYILAQPLLFFRKHTQTLWVEHLSSSEENKIPLLETAVLTSKEKHLQSVWFDNSNIAIESIPFKYKKLNDQFIEIPTTRSL
jgi:hypothetical protein